MDTMSSHLYCQSLVTWIGEGNDPFSSLLLHFCNAFAYTIEHIRPFFVNPIQVIGFYLSVLFKLSKYCMFQDIIGHCFSSPTL